MRTLDKISQNYALLLLMSIINTKVKTSIDKSKDLHLNLRCLNIKQDNDIYPQKVSSKIWSDCLYLSRTGEVGKGYKFIKTNRYPWLI